MYVPFTGLGLHGGFRGNVWLENRITVFKEYVLTALMAQKKREFIIWVSWRPEEKDNPLVVDLYRTMQKLDGLRTVFTYHGLCFYDDKYPDVVARDRLMNSLSRSLPELKEYVDWADEVYVTCQPSDDMFMDNYVEAIQDIEFGDNKVAGFTKGYIINYANKEVAEYNPDTIPPFSTIRYPKDVFLDPERHFIWFGPYKSHEDVLKLGFIEIPGRGFIVGTHQENISTTWNIPYKGKPVSDMVLFNAGVYFARPIVQKKNRRIIARNIYNRLPLKSVLKCIYYKFNLVKYV